MQHASLAGRVVVLARQDGAAAPLKSALETLGAAVRVVPTTQQIRVTETGKIARALGQENAYSHIAFSSPTAVRFFLEVAAELATAAAGWRTVRVAAIGPGTARALAEAGLEPAVTSSGGGGAALARLLLEEEKLGPSHRVLLPQSKIARPELRAQLEAAGVAVDAIAVYDTVPVEPATIQPFLQWLAGGHTPDGITFASPSALEAFLQLTGTRGRELLENRGVGIVSIGATTSKAIVEAGLRVAAEAAEPTTEGMVQAVVRALES
jgi:uroporphyrinogen-III synthase